MRGKCLRLGRDIVKGIACQIHYEVLPPGACQPSGGFVIVTSVVDIRAPAGVGRLPSQQADERDWEQVEILRGQSVRLRVGFGLAALLANHS